MHIDCRFISSGQAVCPIFMQAYTAFSFCAVICQNGYFMITGVLYPTPSSKNRIFCPAWVRRKFSYRSAALC